jgi:putative DNA primase/helicase
MDDVSELFHRAMAERGLRTQRIEADGRMHRCGTERRPRGKNGVYCLHLDGAVPAGWFQNHEDGLGVTKWRAERMGSMTEAERLAWRQAVQKRRAERDAETAALNLSAARRAARIWQLALDLAPDHPYLAMKRIRPHGARAWRGLCVIPIHNAVGGLVSLQFIGPDGAKKFLTGGQKRGCYTAIAEPDQEPEVVCIGEGFATMASVHEATGYFCVAAFDCGNLLPVAQIWRRKLPATRIVLCADNDKAGLASAAAVVRAIPNCAVVWPDFGEGRAG